MTTDHEFDATAYMATGGVFAEHCAELRDRFPGRTDTLEDMMIYVATELWDRYFSQTEIRTAFELAITHLKPYAVHESRKDDK